MALDFDAVSLDVGGVLVVPEHGVLAHALDRVPATYDRSRFGPAHYLGMAAIDQASSDPEFFGDYAWGFLDAIDVVTDRRADAHAAIDAVLKTPIWCQPVPGSRAAVRALVDAGLVLTVTSNSDGTVADTLRRHEWLQVGDGPGAPVATVTDSGIIGVGKPDPRVFQATIDALGLPPDRILHIGDSVHYDVDGALAMGMQAVHMDPYGLCPSTEHRHVRLLAEVLA